VNTDVLLQNTCIELMMLSIGVLHSLGHFMGGSLSLLRNFLTFFILLVLKGQEWTRWVGFSPRITNLM
jgi:hypothetical protein